MDKKAILVACMVAISFGAVIPITLADSEDVTVTWIVPGDDTITVSFPTGQGKIEFDATSEGKNFSDLAATGQTSTVAAMRVTNNGNQALKIEARFTSDWPSGVEYVNVSVGDNTGVDVYWTDSNETVNQTLVSSLAMSAHEDFWFWTTGHNVAKTAGVDRTLRVYSSTA